MLFSQGLSQLKGITDNFDDVTANKEYEMDP